MKNVPSSLPEDKPRFADIDQAVKTGRWHQAESSIREFLSKEPEDAQLWNRLGCALWGQARYGEAAQAYYQALVRKPDWTEALVNLVQTLLRLDRIDEAATVCSLSLLSDPNNFLAHHHLGLALVRQQRYEAAVQAFRRALELDSGSPEAQFAYGDVLRKLGEEDKGLDALREAVRLRPDYSRPLTELGYSAYVRGNAAEAEELLRRAVVAAPDAAWAHYYLGLVMSQAARTEDSIASFQRAVACSPRWVEARIELAYALSLFGCLGAAEIEAKEAVNLVPNFFASQLALVSVLVQAERYPEAENAARAALSLSPDHAGIHSRMAEILFHLDRPDEAAKEAKAALGLNSGLPYPHYLLGLVCERRKQRKQALAHFKRYLECSPEDTMGIGLYLAHQGIANAPERSPENYLNRLYHTRATFWDQTTGSKRPYRGASMVANALSRLKGDAAQGLDILDAGCGTGLVGVLVRPKAAHLDGIDLSVHMLEKARAKKIYDHLESGDMLTYMQSRPTAYDIITSAATLIHFGDLRPVFSAAATSLRDNGLFLFTLFPYEEGEGVTVNSYSCYSHSLGYVTEQASAAGFGVELAEQEIHEYNGEVPVMGWIVALRRLPG